jgi:GNAT superfamily N-acetyltransferase
VPIAEDPERADGRALLDGHGRVLARFTAGDRDGRPIADRLERAPGVPLDAVVAAIGSDLPGWIVAGDEELGRALLAAGGRGRRHAHLRSRDLRAAPAGPPSAAPPGVRIGPLDRDAAALAAVYAAAYPPEHPDWTYGAPPADPQADLADILAGRTVGPVLACSRLAVDAAGAVAGALIVTEAEGEPPVGGPWVAELFRRPGPELRGTGRALLEAGLAEAGAAGLPTLGLAVTEGNPAERLYAALGFERVLTTLVVVVAGG